MTAPPQEERLLTGLNYKTVLARLHERLLPRVYAEIGVRYGDSLALTQPGTRSVGIDPAPALRVQLPRGATLVESTSDDFFARQTIAEVAGAPADMSFIDGLHKFDFALRDFRNIERNSDPGGVILFHDCHPPLERWTSPHRSGDVWKLIVALYDVRPDLEVWTIEAPPSGIALVCNLDPASTALWDRYDEVLATYGALDYATLAADGTLPVNPVPASWRAVRALLPTPYRARPSGHAARMVARRASDAVERAVPRRVLKRLQSGAKGAASNQ